MSMKKALLILIILALFINIVNAKTIVNESQVFGGSGISESFPIYMAEGTIDTNILIYAKQNLTFYNIFYWASYMLGDIYYISPNDMSLKQIYNTKYASITGVIVKEGTTTIIDTWNCILEYNTTYPYVKMNLWMNNGAKLTGTTNYNFYADYLNGTHQFSTKWYFWIKGTASRYHTYSTLANCPTLSFFSNSSFYVGQWITIAEKQTEDDSFITYTTATVSSNLKYATNVSSPETFNLTFKKNNAFSSSIDIYNGNYKEYSNSSDIEYTENYANSTLANREIYISYYESGVLKGTYSYQSSTYSIPETGLKISGYTINSKTLSTLNNVNVSAKFLSTIKYSYSDSNGFYQVSGLNPSTYFINASLEGYNLYSINKSITANTNLTIYLIPIPNYNNTLYKNAVYGIVVDKNNQPLEDALISIQDFSTLTNEYGYFEITNLTINNSTLKAQKEGYISYTENINITTNQSYYRSIVLLDKSSAISKPDTPENWRQIVIDSILWIPSGEYGKMPSESKLGEFLLVIAIIILLYGLYALFKKKN